MSFVLHHYRSQMSGTRFGGPFSEHRFGSLNVMMEFERASEMVTNAINGEPFPEDDYRKAMTLRGAASVPAQTVGDAKMKASYWMAVASRVVSSRPLADEAKRLLSSISREDYDDQSTNRIGPVGGSAVEKILDYAVLKPPSLDSGMVDPKVKGIPEILTNITDPSRVENAQQQYPVENAQQQYPEEEGSPEEPSEEPSEIPDWLGPAVAAVGVSALLVGLAINQRKKP